MCGDACIEQLPELCQGYEPQNVLNLDELGLFIKTLSEKGWMEKGKKIKGGRKSKQFMTVMFILASDGSLVFKSTVLQISKGPRYSKSLKDPLKPISAN